MSHPELLSDHRLSRHTWMTLAQRHRAIAVLRVSDGSIGLSLAQAVARGGIPLIEITWNSDRAPHLISQLRSELPHCVIGAGTLLTLADVRDAIAAGAQFLFSPHTHIEMIELATRLETPMIPGALSPTEILLAWQAGAASVKVFPIQAMGGATYIQQLRGPLGHIPLIPTGGVTLGNARTFVEAGAIAVGLASDLVPQAAIATHDWPYITEQAKTLVTNLADLCH